MPETDPAPVMEEKAVANGGAAADVAAPEKDMATKEVPAKTQSKDAAVADKSAEEQNKVSENGTEGPKDGDVKMAEAESAKEGDDVGAAEQLDSGDVRKDADTKEDDSSKPAEGEDINMEEAKSVKENQGEADEVKQVVSEDLKKDAEAKEDDRAKPAKGEDVKMAEAGNIAAKDEGQMEDKDENKNVDQQDELKEKEKGGSADVDERKGKETGVADKQEEDEAEEKGSADKKVEEAGDKKFNANEEKAEKDSADNHGKDSKVTEEQVSEADKVVEENKEETPKNKKARSARDRSQGKDKKQDGTKSREAKSLLNTPSPCGTDRPQRERKTVERLVEAIEKEPNKNFVVEKGRGTPLKDIPSVAFRISRKKPGDLKFLHSILFGRKGKAADFKGHILQFSGFVWHESDEKMRAKAKEKLDKCVKDVLLDLCWLFAIPVPKANARKEDIVTKLLDFIAEPHAVGDSGLSDDQGSHSRKRKRGGSSSKIPDSTLKKCGDLTSAKRPKKALEFNSDEDEDDHESMKSDSEENKDEDPDVGADEQEDDYDSGKENAGKMSSEVKESSGRKKTYRGSGHKTGTPRTISKSPTRKSSSKISKEQESPNDSAKVFSRKRKPSSKASAEKETKEKRPSGKKMIKGKGASAEADLPSKDELRKTIIGILKKVDFNTATFSDILKKLDNHYKMDLAPKKEAIKVMIQDELTKLSEADEDEDGQDAGKKQQQHQAKEVKA